MDNRFSDVCGDPALLMGDTLCSYLRWMDSTEDLVDILSCRLEEVTLPMLGAAFFERGWRVPRQFFIHPTCPIALGDIGYVTEDHHFVVVDSVHHSLQAESGTLSWSKHLMSFTSTGQRDIEDTPSDIIVSRSGKPYQRRRQVHNPFYFNRIKQLIYSRLRPLTISADLVMCMNLEYENLDEIHAWALLQRDAHSIIAKHNLSVGPHDLRIGE